MKAICKKRWLKINLWAFKYCPPGYRADTEMTFILINVVVAVIYSLISFGYGIFLDCRKIVSWKRWLNDYAPGYLEMRTEEFREYGRYMIELSKEEMVMTPFHDLVLGTLFWFLLSGVLVMVTFMISHYMHYRSETMSIYVMKRVKGYNLRGSYFKVPVRCFVIHMLICLGLLLVYFLGYQMAIKILL